MWRWKATCGSLISNGMPMFGDHLVPAADADIAIDHVVVAQPHVERRQRRRILVLDLAVDQAQHRIGVALELVVVLEPVLAVAALQAGMEGVGGIGRNLVAEQIERQREVQVRLFLDGRQVDDAELAHRLDIVGIVDAGLLHRLAGALDDAGDAGLAHEHVVGFLGQHEAAGARQRIEAGLRQRFELHLAVAVGEVGEHEERQPVRRLLVEGAEHARRVGIAGAALQQGFRLLAAVGAEIFLQQIDHRPEVAAFLDIDLEQVAHVVERGRGLAEIALLLDRGRLGVALDHDQAAQHGAVFARHFLPGVLALVRAERNLAAFDCCGASSTPQRYSGMRT